MDIGFILIFQFSNDEICFIKNYEMKNIICIILCISFSKINLAQTDSMVLYYSFSSVPAFTITTVPDSTMFKKIDIKKKKETLIIFFSPDCEHCQNETKKMLADFELIKNMQIIMVSTMEHHYIKKFYEDFKIGDYPNIIMGREPTYQLGAYYKVQSLPTTFIYNKKGKFRKMFKGIIPVDQITEALHN